jgi:hypothetical protein
LAAVFFYASGRRLGPFLAVKRAMNQSRSEVRNLRRGNNVFLALFAEA